MHIASSTNIHLDQEHGGRLRRVENLWFLSEKLLHVEEEKS